MYCSAAGPGAVADLIPAVDEARAAGVLVESGNGLGFRHPLIRSALYEEIPTPVRAAWHREAARARERRARDRVARHLLAAINGSGDDIEPMDEWILRWLDQPHLVVRPGSPRGRGTLSTGRARITGWLHPAPRRLRRLAEALYRVGDTAEAERVAHQALWPRPPTPISSSTCTGRSPSAACSAGRFPNSWPESADIRGYPQNPPSVRSPIGQAELAIVVVF